MRIPLSVIGLLLSFCAFAQELPSHYRTKTFAVRDSIQIDTVSINSSRFLVKTKQDSVIDSSFYDIDFSKALMVLRKPIANDSVVIDYLRFPDFMTRRYFQLNDKIIVEDTKDMQRLYKLQQSTVERTFTPFEGFLPKKFSTSS